MIGIFIWCLPFTYSIWILITGKTVVYYIFFGVVSNTPPTRKFFMRIRVFLGWFMGTISFASHSRGQASSFLMRGHRYCIIFLFPCFVILLFFHHSIPSCSLVARHYYHLILLFMSPYILRFLSCVFFFQKYSCIFPTFILHSFIFHSSSSHPDLTLLFFSLNLSTFLPFFLFLFFSSISYLLFYLFLPDNHGMSQHTY